MYGALVNNIWSVSSSEQGGVVQQRLIQPFINYNLPGGLPHHVAGPHRRLEGESSQRWTVPLGGGVGKIFHLGALPVNTPLRPTTTSPGPTTAANWQLRLQVQLMFPK